SVPSVPPVSPESPALSLQPTRREPMTRARAKDLVFMFPPSAGGAGARIYSRSFGGGQGVSAQIERIRDNLPGPRSRIAARSGGSPWFETPMSTRSRGITRPAIGPTRRPPGWRPGGDHPATRRRSAGPGAPRPP
ncbi:MAG: hypothetical protein ACK56I_14160, partial [bacterium]